MGVRMVGFSSVHDVGCCRCSCQLYTTSLQTERLVIRQTIPESIHNDASEVRTEVQLCWTVSNQFMPRRHEGNFFDD